MLWSSASVELIIPPALGTWLVFPGARGSCVPRPIESGTACVTYGTFLNYTAGDTALLGGASRCLLTAARTLGMMPAFALEAYGTPLRTDTWV